MKWMLYFEIFAFLNVAKFPTLARLIIRYSIPELLQHVNIFMLRNISGESNLNLRFWDRRIK